MTKSIEKAFDTQISTLRLREILPVGSEITVITRTVSRSGMMRRLTLLACVNGKIEDITWDAARAFGDPVKQGGAYVQDAGMVVKGCGMDMHFHIVSELARVLHDDYQALTKRSL